MISNYMIVVISFMENIRFHPEEEQNNEDFAKQLAECGDYFVNDSFSVTFFSTIHWLDER